MAGTIAIKNGYVFDPLNEINGEIMDIFIRDGKVVRELSAAELKDAKVIDVSGMTVMPGGVDSHSHVAGAKVNAGRSMRPEDHYKANLQKTSLTFRFRLHCPLGLQTGIRLRSNGLHNCF